MSIIHVLHCISLWYHSFPRSHAKTRRKQHERSQHHPTIADVQKLQGYKVPPRSLRLFFISKQSLTSCNLCRDRQGKIIKAAPFQSTLASGTVARIEPNRRWFGMGCHSFSSCLFHVFYFLTYFC